MALNSGTYVADDGDLGLVAYGGVLESNGGEVSVQVHAPVRRRVYIGPLNLLVEIDAGAITEFSYNEAGSVTVSVSQQENSPAASQIAIWIESTSGDVWSASSDGGEIVEGRGGWILQIGDSGASFTLSRG